MSQSPTYAARQTPPRKGRAPGRGKCAAKCQTRGLSHSVQRSAALAAMRLELRAPGVVVD